ncbi:acetyltransferase (GNAT) family protein [Mumia flava]|uniref:Acetyltransferase (GNAT) family protein n=1 Tax=Mumia flava TaxID=1348852 RepID=A0A2M9BDF0_9ACTN|nr:GNAT family N-acetyltransferase [Mumia flava]PJJ55973.1 acetyltransferase (GNAT) family protein [Mumia flava]
MGRLPIDVREARPDDASELIDLWRRCVSEARAGEPHHGVLDRPPPTPEEAAEALRYGAACHDRSLYVATCGGRVAGALHLSVAQVSPIHVERTPVVSDLLVHPDFRRRGVASALLATVAEVADDVDSEMVFAWAPSASRDAHRFLTRLGFGQYATVRAARVRVLAARSAIRTTSSKGAGRLIAVRRSLRRTLTEPVGRARSD